MIQGHHSNEYKKDNPGYKACTGRLTNAVTGCKDTGTFRKMCEAPGVVYVCVMHHKIMHDALHEGEPDD